MNEAGTLTHLLHGIQQKLSAGGILADPKKVPKDWDEANARVQAAWAVNAVNGRRTLAASAGLSDVDAEILSMAHKAVQTAYMAKHDVKAVKALTKEQIADIDRLAKAYAEKKADEFRPIAEQTIAAEKAKREQVKAVNLEELGL